MPPNDPSNSIDTRPPATSSPAPDSFAPGRIFCEFESFDYDADEGAYRVLYDPNAVDPSTAVVSALAAISDTDPVEMDSLHTAVDTDCLNSIASMQPATGDVEIAFQLHGHSVRIKSSGSIEITAS